MSFFSVNNNKVLHRPQEPRFKCKYSLSAQRSRRQAEFWDCAVANAGNGKIKTNGNRRAAVAALASRLMASFYFNGTICAGIL